MRFTIGFINAEPPTVRGTTVRTRVRPSLASAEEFPLLARICDNEGGGRENGAENESEQPALSFVTPGRGREAYGAAFRRVYLIYRTFDKHGAGCLFESPRTISAIDICPRYF